jgi:subtilase family serine protease
MPKVVRNLSLSLVAAALIVMVVAAGAGAAPSARAKLAGSVPSWATAARFKASAAPTSYVNFRVYLGWRNEAGAIAVARSVSDPASPSYGQYLTPAQFRQQFAPTQADVNAVRSWLTSQGFTVDYTPANNHYVAAEGTVTQVQTAFAVTLGEYTYDGLTLRAPASDLQIPSTLAGIVSGVVGIDQSSALVHPDSVGQDAAPSPGYRNAQPWSTYWDQNMATTLPEAYGSVQPYAVQGYTPKQLEGAYGVAGAIGSGNDGTGVTVAIIDAYASPTILSDANTYATTNGLAPFAKNQFQQVVAPGTYRHPESKAQDPQGWYGEETLDVEAVHSMAPGATVVYVGSPNNYQDMDAAMNHVVDRHLADIVTNSYGWSGEDLPNGVIKPFNDTLIQAAAEGIGVCFSSGDSGDEVANLGYPSVDWPASSPWVTAVGGTSLGVGSTDNYLFETGWGTTRSLLSADGLSWDPTPPGVYLYGGGGGTSRLFAQPWYQVGVVPASIANRFSTTPGRAVPDVAMDADPTTGMLVGQTQTWSDGSVSYDTYRIGGTSLASPLFAGVMALADQLAEKNGGHALGFANPALYAAYSATKASGSAAFHDIVNPTTAAGAPTTLAAVRSDFINGENDSAGIRYSLRSFNQTGTIKTAPGYDDVTGVGTPNGNAFLAQVTTVTGQ